MNLVEVDDSNGFCCYSHMLAGDYSTLLELCSVQLILVSAKRECPRYCCLFSSLTYPLPVFPPLHYTTSESWLASSSVCYCRLLLLEEVMRTAKRRWTWLASTVSFIVHVYSCFCGQIAPILFNAVVTCEMKLFQPLSTSIWNNFVSVSDVVTCGFVCNHRRWLHKPWNNFKIILFHM